MKSQLTDLIGASAGDTPLIKAYAGNDLIWTSGPPKILDLDFSDPTSYVGTGTTVNDISGEGGTGTFYGDTSFISRSDGTTFDGTGDYIRFSRSDINGGSFAYSEISVNVWVKKNVDSGGPDNIFTIENTLEIAYWGTGIRYASTPWSWRGNTTGDIIVGDWHMITYTHSNSSRKVYVDGVEVFTSSDSGNLSSGSGTYPYLTLMGRYTGTSDNTNGQLGSVEMYNGVLSQENITNIYNSTKDKFSDSLVIHLDAADTNSYPGSGTTWFDLSGNGNDATMTNLTTDSALGGSFYFDGSSSVATIPFDASMDFDDEQTIMMCFKATENDTNRRNPYGQAYGGGGTWTHETDGRINYYFGSSGTNGGSYTALGSNNVAAQDEAVIFATVRDSSESISYKNGTQLATGSGRGDVVTGTNSILIGDGYTNNFMGNIAFVKVWKRKLSPQEIADEYTLMANRLSNDLLLHYDATNPSSYPGTGTVWYDLSGNGINGTIGPNVTYDTNTGGSFRFTDTGSNSKVSFSHSDFAVGLGDFTLEVFLFDLYDGDSSYRGVFASGGTDGIRGIIMCKDKSWVGHSSSSESIDYNWTQQDNGTWTQFIFLREGPTMRIYQNANFRGEVTQSSPDSIDSINASLGQRYHNNYNYGFGGHIGLVRFYTKALTPTEITDNYNADIGKFTGTLVGSFTVSSPSNTSDTIDLSWTPASNVDSYRVKVKLPGSGSYITALSSTTSTTYTYTGATADSTYWFYIEGSNAYHSTITNYLSVTTSTAPASPDPAPGWASDEISDHKTRVLNDGGSFPDEDWYGHDWNHVIQTYWEGPDPVNDPDNNEHGEMFSAAGGYKGNKYYNESGFDDNTTFNFNPRAIVNGRPVLSFDKTNTFRLGIGNVILKPPVTYFFNLNIDPSVDGQLTLSSPGDTIDWDFYITYNQSLSRLEFKHYGYASVNHSVTSGDLTDCRIAIVQDTATTFKVYVNGTSVGAGSRYDGADFFDICSPSFFTPSESYWRFVGDLIMYYSISVELSDAEAINLTTRT
jgi:hypothetical protein